MFAGAANANVMRLADYDALVGLLTGFQSGTARSQQPNTAGAGVRSWWPYWRNASLT